MELRQLGNTACKLSKMTLGTMTWGNQNSEKEGHEQIDYALDQGINCIDLAELYPVPANEKTYGDTERIFGSWLSRQQHKRADIVLTSKVCGPSKLKYIRPKPDLDRKSIREAITNSLQRMQTDYIDLYQLHWPSRTTNFFSQLNYTTNDNMGVSIAESLEAMAELVQEGLIRYIGVSNETAWGIMHYLSESERKELPKIVSIQNPYNLLNRSFEVAMAEVCWREKVSLLAYSPLAFGVLSGKYLNEKPPRARLTMFSEFPRYNSPIATAAVADYVRLAQEFSLDPAQMALAFVNKQPFVGSNIIGATTMQQLKSNIASKDIVISAELNDRIEELSILHSNPCP